jgi:hypothetical protein
MRPLIVHSDLTGRWYVATRYKELGNGQFMASTKWDATDQIKNTIFELRRTTRNVSRTLILRNGKSRQ